MKELPKYLTVKQSDGSVWGVPVEMIARNRAEFYAHLHGNNVEQSLQNNTVPLFVSDPDEISYWAIQKMRWSDFDGHQVQLSPPEPVDFQKGWLSGEKGLAPQTPPAGESQPAGKKAASTVNVVMYQDASFDTYIDRIFRSRSSAEGYVTANFGPEARVWIEDRVIHD